VKAMNSKTAITESTAAVASRYLRCGAGEDGERAAAAAPNSLHIGALLALRAPFGARK
jgi:hypothetical protein